MAFLIWSLVSLGFIVMAMVCFLSKKPLPFGFWANAEVFEVSNVRAYNRALGKLWLVFGIALEIFGLPLLNGQNSGLIIFTIIGVMFLSIITMAIYTTVIEPKYRRK